jgi:DNA-binding transcriptional regulator YdaS (Cro superfamily)
MVLHYTTPYGDNARMDLKTYLETMSLAQRVAFAARCGTTAGHLRNISYGYKPCGESLAINIERESGREVTCEQLRPDVDWAVIRGTSLTKQRTRERRIN